MQYLSLPTGGSRQTSRIVPLPTPVASSSNSPLTGQLSGMIGGAMGSDILVERIYTKAIQELQRYQRATFDQKREIVSCFQEKKGEEYEIPLVRHIDRQVKTRLQKNPFFLEEDYPFLNDKYLILKEDFEEIEAVAKTESFDGETSANASEFEQVQPFIEVFNAAFPSEVEEKYVPIARWKMQNVYHKTWKYDEAGQRGNIIPKAIPGARLFFLHMFQCHHPVVMEESLDYLLRLLEHDPIIEVSELDLVNLQKGLLSEIQAERAENLNRPLSLMLIKTYATAIECYLFHSNKGNCPALQQKTKEAFWDGISTLKGLVLREKQPDLKKDLFWFVRKTEPSPGEEPKASEKEKEVVTELLNYWVHFAEQAVQRIQTDVTDLQRSMQRVVAVADAAVQLTGLWGVVQGNQSASAVLSETFGSLQRAFAHWESKDDWFERVLIFKNVARIAMTNLDQFRKLTTVIKEYKKEEGSEKSQRDIFLLYGIIGVLEQVVLKSTMMEIQAEAFNSMLQYLTVDDRQIQDRVALSLMTMINVGGSDHVRNTAYVVLKILGALLTLFPHYKTGLVERVQRGMKSFPRFRFGHTLEADQHERFFFNVIHTFLRRICEVREEVDVAGQSLLTLIACSSRQDVLSVVMSALSELTTQESGKDVYGNTLYHVLAKQKRYKIYGLVSQYYRWIDINARDYERGDTALHIAVQTDCIDCIHELVRLGANPNIQNEEGNAPLHIAALKGSLDVVKVLLELGASGDSRNHHQQTPLNCAIQIDSLPLVTFMITSKLPVAQLVSHSTPLLYAAQVKAEKILEALLLEIGAPNPQEVREILRMMCEDGKNLSCSVQFARFHLTRCLENLSYEGAFAKYKSVPQPQTLDDPMKIGYQVHAPSPTIKAIQQKKFHELFGASLRRSQVNLYATDGLGNTALHYLVKHPGLTVRIKEFARDKGALNLANFVGFTPLHVAVLCANDTGARALLSQAGTSVNCEDHEGFTPLHYAVLLKNPSLVFLLRQFEASLTSQNIYGDSPLHIACGDYRSRFPKNLLAAAGLELEELQFSFEGNLPIVSSLIMGGADPFVVDAFGNTPLHRAAVYGEGPVIDYLLSRFPDLFWVQNKRGHIALEEAVVATNFANARSIISAMAKGNLLAFHEKMEERAVAGNGLADILVQMNAGELFSELLQAKPDVGKSFGKNPMHWTPLHVAATCGASSIIDAYLERRIDLNHPDAFNNTAGHLAALRGKKEFLEAWLLADGDPKRTNRDGRNIFHLATVTGHRGCVEFLLDKKMSIYEKDAYGKLPIHLAAQKGDLPIVQLLFASEAKDKEIAVTISAQERQHWYVNPPLIETKNDDQKTPFFLACGNNQVAMAEFLLGLGANREASDLHGATALHVAAQQGFAEVAALLLKNHAHIRKVDHEGESCLHKAAFNGHDAIVNLLVEADHRAHLNRPDRLSIVRLQDYAGETALHEVCKRTNREGDAETSRRLAITVKLLDFGASPFQVDNEGVTPFHHMCEQGSLTEVQHVLNIWGSKKSHKIHEPDKKGRTPLYKVAARGKIEVARILIRWGAVANKGNNKGRTPFHVAVYNSDRQMMNLLLDSGADIVAVDKEKRTALHMLLQKEVELSSQAYEIIEVLIRRRPDLLVLKDKEESTPLHNAAENGHLRAVSLILDHLPGPDSEKREYIFMERKGKTAADLAASVAISDAILFFPPQQVGSAHETTCCSIQGCFTGLKGFFRPTRRARVHPA